MITAIHFAAVEPFGRRQCGLRQLQARQPEQGQHRLQFADGIVNGEVGTQSLTILYQITTFKLS